MAKILVVEDDDIVAEAIVDALQVERHTMERTRDGQEGLDRLLIYEYDLAIIDWMLPSLTGPEICKQFRAKGGTLPILMLTGKGTINERVHGLDSGADDYLTKPFSLHELSARVRALLRRPAGVLPETLQAADLIVDIKQGKATRAGRDIQLLPKELAVLEFLLRHKEQVFSVNDLLNHVWSSESDSSEDAVRQVIARLRKKIDADNERSLIVTVKGLGYKIEDGA